MNKFEGISEIYCRYNLYTKQREQKFSILLDR